MSSPPQLKMAYNGPTKIYRMNLGFTADQISEAIIESVKRNNLKSGYIRPFAFYDDIIPNHRKI